ncbi:hypothetical protein SAMN05421770_104115 [Granulicella rosea]|uniref:Uncharacterized protein n=2 Tax=Granulicella rosea TaxID=474952 RepID=A0A239JVW6_9BACT|nr:hypothetical protein SAMN05421770_104115 [Granulicella rosea]
MVHYAHSRLDPDKSFWQELSTHLDGPSREGFRRLQRFTVSLRPQELDRLYALGFLEPVFRSAHVASRDERRTVLWSTVDIPSVPPARSFAEYEQAGLKAPEDGSQSLPGVICWRYVD